MVALILAAITVVGCSGGGPGIAGLSAEDAGCLPPEVANEAELMQWLEELSLSASEPSDQYGVPIQLVPCLSDEGHYRIFVMVAGTSGYFGEGLEEESLSCYWESLRRVESRLYRPRGPIDPVDSQRRKEVELAALFVMSNCMSDGQFEMLMGPASDDGSFPIFNSERGPMSCVVDALGGPEEYLEFIVESLGEQTFSEVHTRFYADHCS